MMSFVSATPYKTGLDSIKWTEVALPIELWKYHQNQMALVSFGVLFSVLILLLCLFHHLFQSKAKNGAGTSLKPVPRIISIALVLAWWRFITYCRYVGTLGSIVQYKTWNLRVVCINDFKLGKELFKNPIFCGKRLSEVPRAYSHGCYGLTTAEGKEWKEQIRFCHQHLKELGFGTKAMEIFIQREIDDVIANWKARNGECFSPNKSFYLPILNSLWGILMGERASTEDPEIVPLVYRVYEYFKEITDFPNCILLVSKTSIETAARIQKWIPIFSGTFGMLKSVDDLRDHFQAKIDKRKAEEIPEQPSNLVDAYLKKIEETTDPQSGFYGETGNLNMLAVMADFFIAGGDTTANQLAWALLHLIRHPDIQEEIRREVHSVVGPDRKPSLQDKPDCPFTEAFILEGLRVTPIALFSLPHVTTEDTSVGPYFIEERTVVLLNIYNFHHDPKMWGDPHNFRPERFLSEDGGKLLRHQEWISTFSLGQRRCPGEQLARDTLFLYVSSLCQEFVLSPDPSLKGARPPLREVRSLFNTPDTFYIVATPAPSPSFFESST